MMAKTAVRYKKKPSVPSEKGILPPPKPFVKWVGGKRQLLDILQNASPKKFNHYFEPFVGGGAFLFALRPAKATVSDINAELINTYEVIRDDMEGLLRSLRTHKNEPEYFYTLRAKNILSMTPIQRASRFIYLNKTCFNGLYRENSRGQFNAPFGRYENPNIADKDNLTAVNRYLSTGAVKTYCRNYQAVLNEARAGDFVYFDPPYIPLTTTASFTKYTGSGFGELDQRELAAMFAELSKRNVLVLLSNSNTPMIHQLYKGFNIQLVAATRAINCKGEKRGREPNEVLIRGY
jgi:DNA adenine methylase